MEAWSTLRMTWVEENKKGRISAIEEVPPCWMNSFEREETYLGL